MTIGQTMTAFGQGTAVFYTGVIVGAGSLIAAHQAAIYLARKIYPVKMFLRSPCVDNTPAYRALSSTQKTARVAALILLGTLVGAVSGRAMNALISVLSPSTATLLGGMCGALGGVLREPRVSGSYVPD